MVAASFQTFISLKSMDFEVIRSGREFLAFWCFSASSRLVAKADGKAFGDFHRKNRVLGRRTQFLAVNAIRAWWDVLARAGAVRALEKCHRANGLAVNGA